jgi:hypothetical protein
MFLGLAPVETVEVVGAAWTKAGESGTRDRDAAKKTVNGIRDQRLVLTDMVHAFLLL